MSANAKPQVYSYVATDIEDGKRPFARRSHPLKYKPTVIKAPSLIVFALILTACVVMIEIIFHSSSTPATMSAFENALTVVPTKSAQMKAASTTSTQATSTLSITTSSTSSEKTTSIVTSSSVTLTGPNSDSKTTISVSTDSALLKISSSSSKGTTTAVVTPTSTSIGTSGPTITMITAAALLTISSSSTVATTPKISSSTTSADKTTRYVTVTVIEEIFYYSSGSVIVTSTGSFVTQGTPPTYTDGTVQTLTMISVSSAFLVLSSSQQATTAKPVTTIYSTPATSDVTSSSLSPILSTSNAATTLASNPSTELPTLTVASALMTISSSTQVIPAASTEDSNNPNTATGQPTTTIGSDVILSSSTIQSSLAPTTKSFVSIITPALTTPASAESATSITAATSNPSNLIILSSSGQSISTISIQSEPLANSAITTAALLSRSSAEKSVSTATTIAGFLTISSSEQAVASTSTIQNTRQSIAVSDLSTSLSSQSITKISTQVTSLPVGSPTSSALPNVSSGPEFASFMTSVQSISSSLTERTSSSAAAAAFLTLSSDGQIITVLPTDNTLSPVRSPKTMTDVVVSSSGQASAMYTVSVTTLYITSSSLDISTMISTVSNKGSMYDSTIVFSPLASSQTDAQLYVSSTLVSSQPNPITQSTKEPVQSQEQITSNAPVLSTGAWSNGYSSQSLVTNDLSSEPSGSYSGTLIPILFTTTSQYTTLIGTTDTAGHSTSILAVVVVQTVFSTTPSPTMATLPDSSSTGSLSLTPISSTTKSFSSTVSLQPIATMGAREMIVNGTFTPVRYFVALYLIPIIAIIIKAFWEVIFSSFKMMEPFQRLSRPDGASAKRALFKQYLSNSISWDAVRTCFSGILPLLTTAIYLFVTVLTVLSSSSMTVRARGYCQAPDGGYLRCDPAWIINGLILRYLEALLFISISATLLVLVFSWRYKTNVASNPSVIVSMASLFNQESLIHDFNQIDLSGDKKLLASGFHDRNCRLEYYESVSGQRYGITQRLKREVPPASSTSKSKRSTFMYWIRGYTALTNPASPTKKIARSEIFSVRIQSIILDTSQLITTLLLFGLVVAYFGDRKSDPFNDFFNSGTIWARLIYVSIATILDMQWKRLEREVRITEPYRRMSKGFARPETTVLLSLNGTCWSELPGSIYRSLRYRHMWFQTLVSIVASLSDLNIVAVAGIAYSDGQTPLSLRVGCYLAISITSLMIVVVLLTMIWWRRGIVGQMPRSPDTIGAIFSYLSASRLVQELGTANLEEWTEKERDEIIIESGWRFRFGKRICADGVERWIVDFEDDNTDQGRPKTNNTVSNETRRRDRENEGEGLETQHLVESHQ